MLSLPNLALLAMVAVDDALDTLPARVELVLRLGRLRVRRGLEQLLGAERYQLVITEARLEWHRANGELMAAYIAHDQEKFARLKPRFWRATVRLWVLGVKP
jgi:hypothetical protein